MLKLLLSLILSQFSSTHFSLHQFDFQLNIIIVAAIALNI